MILLDVNVLLAASRAEHVDHAPTVRWLVSEMSDGSILLADMAVAGFLRIATHRRVFDPPTPLPAALAFIDDLRAHPRCVPVAPGPRHWSILRDLLVEAGAGANLVPDAYLAALAIEHGATIATRDRDFRRFRGVTSVDPVAAS